MTKPKVLIHVVGGIAYWTVEGGVDVVLVDEDNIKAGDALVPIKSKARLFKTLTSTAIPSHLCLKAPVNKRLSGLVTWLYGCNHIQYIFASIHQRSAL
ncbi:MAG: hypothetical protein ACKO15_04470 [Burkholderiales bacterium]